MCGSAAEMNFGSLSTGCLYSQTGTTGLHRNVSRKTPSTYGRFGLSLNSGRQSVPTTRSISSWALVCTFGLSSIARRKTSSVESVYKDEHASNDVSAAQDAKSYRLRSAFGELAVNGALGWNRCCIDLPRNTVAPTAFTSSSTDFVPFSSSFSNKSRTRDFRAVLVVCVVFCPLAVYLQFTVHKYHVLFDIGHRVVQHVYREATTLSCALLVPPAW